MSHLLPLPPIIHTPRLTLRAGTEADIPTIHAFRSDPDVMRFMLGPVLTSIDQTAAWFHSRFTLPLPSDTEPNTNSASTSTLTSTSSSPAIITAKVPNASTSTTSPIPVSDSGGKGCIYLLSLNDPADFHASNPKPKKPNQTHTSLKADNSPSTFSDATNETSPSNEEVSTWGGVWTTPKGSQKPALVIGTMGSKALPELGYGIHPDHWGKGLATEAVNAFAEAYFGCIPTFHDGGEERSLSGIEDADMRRRLREMGEKRNFLLGKVVEENVGSWKVLEKCGFERVRREEVKEEQGMVWTVWYKLWRRGFREREE